MTARQPPLWLDSEDHEAEDLRRTGTSFVRAGICSAGAFEVTEKSGTPDMSVDVAEGLALIDGSESTYQGIYGADNRGVRNVAITTADATNPRIDLICARVRDAEYSGADNDWDVIVVTGTAAASPSEPTLPDNALELARVDVDASATSIVDADITDRREAATAIHRTPAWFTTSWTSGTTSGTTELTLATVNIPAQPFAYKIHCAAEHNCINNTDDDYFRTRIKVDGTTVGESAVRHSGGANQRLTHAIPASDVVSIPADTACAVTVTTQRLSGTGTLDTNGTSRLTATIVEQF